MSIWKKLFGRKQEDPYCIFDPNQHFVPRVTRSDYESKHGEDFFWLLWSAFFQIIEPDYPNEDLLSQRLSYGQKAIYFRGILDGQVNNGGFIQLFYNDCGKYVPAIIKCFKYIGDDQMAELTQRAFQLFLEDADKIEVARLKDLSSDQPFQAFSMLYKNLSDLDACDNIYYEICGQVAERLERYVRRHPDEFCVDEHGAPFAPES